MHLTLNTSFDVVLFLKKIFDPIVEYFLNPHVKFLLYEDRKMLLVQKSTMNPFLS
jgi:hypothetical protein